MTHGDVHGSCWSPVPRAGHAGHLDCTTSSTIDHVMRAGSLTLKWGFAAQEVLTRSFPPEPGRGKKLRLDSLVERHPGTRGAGPLLSRKAPVLVVHMLKCRVLCLLPPLSVCSPPWNPPPPPIQKNIFFSFYHDCVVNFVLYINLPFSVNCDGHVIFLPSF